jgi:hypothetical protein
MPLVRDFTLAKYRELVCCLRDHGYAPETLAGYLRQPEREKDRLVILRHDVDISPAAALRMARVEHDLGIRASYYFRHPSTFHPPTIQAVSTLGHEVGYHYEVLTTTRGDYEGAIRLFGEKLAAFREVFPVETVAAHGGSRSDQDTRDIWNRCRFGDFGLRGEAYLSIPGFLYFSDTGRTWNPGGKVRDSIPGGRPVPEGVRTTDDLMAWVGSAGEPRLALNAHPERWPEGTAGEILSIGQDLVYNLVKRGIRGVKARGMAPAGTGSVKKQGG